MIPQQEPIFLWMITRSKITPPYDNLNKIPQATQCGATLVVSKSFISKLASYIHNFCDKKAKKSKSFRLKKIV